ncbi:hypothetical protein SODALDRAFT_333614 [Sodiomyces alkalinus F11]|uniref:Uncharacterized protein n=1 Tax=Sodiomyces alkalinus (strain CBS 110278 / VKM F-3762 / F11) TaxID=1314773 RepID=A0A3N2PTN9_SODAK|nr:hypothetical protein SODALDRAFT_333614 [Sodiomyces alkalinus F11]ROT37858.1 hypothetical protein SODALDRAFT_333614 [Sodiomyces alkalinus F11]
MGDTTKKSKTPPSSAGTPSGGPNRRVDVFLALVRKDMLNTRIHTYWPVYVAYGQKAYHMIDILTAHE